MKFNIANPALGAQICIDIDDEKTLRHFYDKRISQEVLGECLGPEYNGYVFRISGGNDKQGFPMKQGVLVPSRVRLLMKEGSSCYRTRRDGERKRKSVRGCIVSSELSILNLVVIKTGEKEIEGLSNQGAAVARRLGPKRASNIRKLFNLEKGDDVRKYVIRRKFEHKGKQHDKAPKIQRLVTPVVLQRKRQRALAKNRQREKTRLEAAEYHRIHAQRVKEQNEARRSSAAARRSSRKESGVKA